MKTQFSSWLARSFEQHVALKRAAGRDFTSQADLLAQFDRYLVTSDVAPPLTRVVLHRYLASLSQLSRRGRDNAVSAVWPALGFARRRGAAVEPLPERPRRAPFGTREREPVVLSPCQVERLLAATQGLAPTRPFARKTHATLLGLLYTTGLRIGEARALDVGDLAEADETLLIQGGKFKKSRLLPIPPSTVEALVRYRDDDLRPIGTGSEEPFFVSCRRRRLSRPAATRMLKRAAELASLDGCSLPRLHDLRHAFAVHRILDWYRDGHDVNALLPVLSTYMGHVTPSHTYTYLRSAELLIAEVGCRFERAAESTFEGRAK